MTDQPGHQQTEDAARLRQLAEDWLALWQDELTAVMQDPETMRTWQALLGAWSRMAATILRADPAGADDPPRPAPAAAAPDPRDAEVERLRGQLHELESRVAELERAGRAGRAGGRRPARRVSPRGPA